MHRLGEREISKKTLLEVIETINATVLTKFRRGMREVRQVTSCDVTSDLMAQRSVHLIGEDRNLSFDRMGESYYAVE